MAASSDNSRPRSFAGYFLLSLSENVTGARLQPADIAAICLAACQTGGAVELVTITVCRWRSDTPQPLLKKKLLASMHICIQPLD
jgi:hypothetical protein